MPKLTPETLQRQAEECHDIILPSRRAQELAVELARLNTVVQRTAEQLSLADEPAAYATFLEQLEHEGNEPE